MSGPIGWKGSTTIGGLYQTGAGSIEKEAGLPDEWAYWVGGVNADRRTLLDRDY